MPRNPHDPRFLPKVKDHRKRAVIGRVEHTATMDWGVGGLERQQPRYMGDDPNRPPVPHPYFKYPPGEEAPSPQGSGHEPVVRKGTRGRRYTKGY
jgi:hypothetical protein